ncbi:MAG: iron-containing alcohol dehydrogenase [Steroidobacteraceae bacterium]
MALLPGMPDVHFGYGVLAELAGELQRRGIARPLVLTDAVLARLGIAARVRDASGRGAAASVYDGIPENPTIAGVEGALAAYRAGGCDGIVAVGGGSVLDSGKALRILARQGGRLIDYLNDPALIGPGLAPLITIPTTAGTGAEVTYGGGIHPETNAPALGLRSVHARPDLAICDPELTLSLPPRLTAATGMDALTHCVEGYLSTRENAPLQAIALDGIAGVVRYVERATADGQDREARAGMLMAALEGGMSIWNGLGPIHSLSMAFGDSPLHHGTLVTVAMPAVMRFYAGLPGGKLERVAAAMGLAADGEAGERIAAEVERLNAALGLPASVRAMGYAKSDIGRMAAAAHAAYFNLTSPRPPTLEQFERLVVAVLG